MADDPRSRWGGPGEDYRLDRLRHGIEGAPASSIPAPSDGVPKWTPPAPLRTIPWFEVVFIGLGLLATLVTVAMFGASEGIGLTASMALLALLPLPFVLGLLSYVDRWEPEPIWSRVLVFLWGAGVATFTASVINTASLTDFVQETGDYDGAMTTVAVFVAPIVEEALKGLGVVLIVVWRRTQINSVLDGMVYGGISGAGFAFVENIQYFLQASAEGGGAMLGVTVFMRGVLSPFIHPMATSLTGAALAFAVTRLRTRPAWIWMGPLGWLAASGVHGLWNGLASFGGELWFVFYALIEMPLFIGWIILMLMVSRRHGQAIQRGLEPFVQTGWILAAEIPMISTTIGRRSARRWAKAGGPDATKAMRRFQTCGAQVGMDQMVMSRVGVQPERVAADKAALETMASSRQVFLDAVRAARGLRPAQSTQPPQSAAPGTGGFTGQVRR